jgi:hypothetical protein
VAASRLLPGNRHPFVTYSNQPLLVSLGNVPVCLSSVKKETLVNEFQSALS